MTKAEKLLTLLVLLGYMAFQLHLSGSRIFAKLIGVLG